MHTILVVVAVLTAAYSHYWPPYGGINGGAYVATGELAADWQDTGFACPGDWEFGTRLVMADDPVGTVWECVDRGMLVTYTRSGLPILDFMEQQPRHGHKTAIQIYLVAEIETRHILY